MANKKPFFFTQQSLSSRLGDAEIVALALQNVAGLIPECASVTRARVTKAIDAHNAVKIPSWMTVPVIAPLGTMSIRTVKEKQEVVDALTSTATAMRHRVAHYIDALRNLLLIQTNLNAKKPLWFETNGYNVTSAYHIEVHDFWVQSIYTFFSEALEAAVERTKKPEGETVENVRQLLLVINCIKATARGSRTTPAAIALLPSADPMKRHELAVTLRRSAGPTMVALKRKLCIAK